MIQGVLLAAGEGQRYQASAIANEGIDKLLVTLPKTQASVLATTANTLKEVLPNSLAVIQPHQHARRDCLETTGLAVTTCEQASQGMGVALSHAITKTSQASGWLIMLADMPWISRTLIHQLCQTLSRPTQIVLPVYQGHRGHPVLFGAYWREPLMAVTGDTGAKAIIQENPDHVVTMHWHDSTILQDIDVAADILRER